MSDDKDNAATIRGMVINVGPVETVGQKGHKKQVIAVSTGGQYAQTLGVEFFGKHADKADGIRIGDEIRAHVNVNGREHNGRYYTSLSAWKVDVISKAGGAPAPAPYGAGDDDSLPF